MKHTLGKLSGPARAYVLCVILCGAAVCVYSVADLFRNPVSPEWLILVALTVASGWARLHIPGMPISFSISDTFNIAAALLFGPSAGAITAALDGLVLTFRFSNNQRSLDRVLFNMAAPAIAIWIAAHIFFALGGNRQPLEGPLAVLRLLALLTMFGTVDFGLNSGLVAIAISFERRVSVFSIWREHLAGVWITYFGGVFAAMLLMVLARFRTLDILILVLPLPVILYVAFRHAVGRVQDQITHLGSVNRVYVGAIEALATAVDAKDQVTHDHTRRVQDETLRLARAMAVDDEGELQAIRAAALLHDVGKLAIPEHILNKPGRLSAAEYDIMKTHAAIGADILAVIGFPYAVAPIVRHHHENWDGTGYPEQLAGGQIPIGSRIIAVVDLLRKGAGALNAKGSIDLAKRIDTSTANGQWWLTGMPSPWTTIGGETLTWNQAIVWGSAIVSGSTVGVNETAWGSAIVWGSSTTWGSAIVWGSNVVWADSASWSQAIVWGSHNVGQDNGTAIVWGSSGPTAESTAWGDLSGNSTAASGQ